MLVYEVAKRESDKIINADNQEIDRTLYGSADVIRVGKAK